MKKTIALLLALLMLLSCVGGVAEEQKTFTLPQTQIPSVTITSNISIDQEAVMNLLPMLGVPEESVGIVQNVLPVLSNLGARLVYADKAGQMDILLKGQEVITAAVAQTEDGFALTSDVIPSYVLVLSNDTIQKLIEQLTSQMNAGMKNLDMEAIMNAAMNYVGEFMGVVQSSLTIGEPEVGEFAIEDVPFNVKTPVTVDAKAMALATLNMVKKIAQDEAFASVLSSAGAVDLSKLDEAIANVENSTEENTPAIAFDIYSAVTEEGAADGYYAVVGTLDTKTEQAGVVNVTVLVVAPVFEMNVDAPAMNLSCVATVLVDESVVTATVSAVIKEMYIGSNTVVALTDTGLHAEEELYFLNEESPLLTDVTDVVFGDAEVTADFSGEGKTVLNLEQLMDDKEGKYSNGLMMNLMNNGLSNLLGKAMSAMPEEMSNLMNLLMPSSGTAVTE